MVEQEEPRPWRPEAESCLWHCDSMNGEKSLHLSEAKFPLCKVGLIKPSL